MIGAAAVTVCGVFAVVAGTALIAFTKPLARRFAAQGSPDFNERVTRFEFLLRRAGFWQMLLGVTIILATWR